MAENGCSEESESGIVMLRRLPSGSFRRGSDVSLEGHSLLVQLERGMGMEFPVSCVVEVDCENLLYLGEVQENQDSRLVIGVEHIVNREAVSLFQGIWKQNRQAS